ncbi:MAG: hypothetical protein GQ559_00855 [Desulfobulbaceae bacterium]|nr:hypothetical protein [Desulfobulbaceae bacterium]
MLHLNNAAMVPHFRPSTCDIFVGKNVIAADMLHGQQNHGQSILTDKTIRKTTIYVGNNKNSDFIFDLAPIMLRLRQRQTKRQQLNKKITFFHTT